LLYTYLVFGVYGKARGNILLQSYNSNNKKTNRKAVRIMGAKQESTVAVVVAKRTKYFDFLNCGSLG